MRTRGSARFLAAETRAPELNLALDAALLELRREPTVRLYRWEPVGLSLGRFQPLEEVEPLRAALPPHRLVRRSTGGRAIWHDARELTFSYVAPAPSRAEAVTASFERVHQALCATLALPGLQFARDANQVLSDREGSPWCFERSTDLCLVLHGHKVLGSAQRRVRGWILHHGSLVLPPELMPSAVLETRVSEALSQALGYELEPKPWREEELAHAMAALAADAATPR